jgi:hypothetical protein
MKLEEILNESKEEKSEGQLVRDWFKTRVSMATGKVSNREKLEDAVKITPSGKASIMTGITAVHIDYRKTAPTKRLVPPPIPIQKLFQSRHKLFRVDYKDVPKELIPQLLLNAHSVGFRDCEVPKFSTLASGLTEIVGFSVHDCNFDGGLMGLFKFPKLQWVNVSGIINGKEYTMQMTNKIGGIMKKHLSSNERDIAECMEELIEAGFKELAKA